MASPVAEYIHRRLRRDTKCYSRDDVAELFVLKSAPLFRWIKKGNWWLEEGEFENCIRSVSTQWGALSDRKFRLHSFTLRARHLLQNKARPATRERSNVNLYDVDVDVTIWDVEGNNGSSFFNLCISPILNGQQLNSSIIIFFKLCGSDRSEASEKTIISTL